VVGPVRDPDRVTGLDGPGADHSQVPAGPAVRTEALGPPHYPHTRGEGLTGEAGRSHLQDQFLADAPLFAYQGLIGVDAGHGEVLPERAVR
jgi:hypothetical protein